MRTARCCAWSATPPAAAGEPPATTAPSTLTAIPSPRSKGKAKNGSTFTGTINIIDNAEGGTAVSDNAIVAIENGCTWNLTGNCTLTSLTNNGTINFNGYIITLADGTVLK